MRIVDLHIYGYGQLENLKITNLTDFQTFYGENEAGKSTIMAFIHGILFGFPTKLQTTELRYEPKLHNKYGGNIRVSHNKLGLGTIERVKGKASGDVKVVMDDGTEGGEELLRLLLNNIDKGLYQSIFSFNIHGLQNIHQMKGEEIGRFLFSTSTLGTERLAKAETRLQKELDVLFKPSGKKPLINEKLQKVHTINYELRKAGAKINEYERLIADKEKFQREMEDINSKLGEVQKENEKIKEWLRIESSVKEQRWLETELHALGEIHFPARGIERLEALNKIMHPLKAEIKSMGERIGQLKQKMESMKPDEFILNDESKIFSLLDKMPIYEQLKNEKLQKETKLVEYEERLSILREKLHLSLNDDEILSINTNILMKKQVEEAVDRSKKLADTYRQLDEDFNYEKEELEAIEAEILSLEKQTLSNQDRSRLETFVNEGRTPEKVEWELRGIQDKIEYYQDAVKRENESIKRNQKQRKYQFLIFEVLFIGLFIFSLLSQQWSIVVFSLIGTLAAIFLWIRGHSPLKDSDMQLKIKNLFEREQQLINQLQSTENRDYKLLEDQLIRDDSILDQLKTLKNKHKHQQGQYERIIGRFEEWERQRAENKKELIYLGEQLKLPKDLADSFLLEAVQILEEYKTMWREKKQLSTRLEQITDELLRISKYLEEAAKAHLHQSDLDMHQSAFLLRDKLRVEQEKKIRWNEQVAKLEDLTADLEQKIQSEKHLQEEYMTLLKEASVDNEEDYYVIGSQAEKYLQLTNQYENLSKQLQYSMLSREEQDECLTQIDCSKMEEENANQLERLKSRLKVIQEQSVSIQYEIQTLEEGGIYSDILHQFKEEKYELEEASKEWAVYSLAQDMLSRTIEKYKNFHLPRMLGKSEEYLSFLTYGKYRKIHLKKSGTGFLVEHTDGILFEANELSQATMEQLYVSIRLSLVTTLYENYSLPIIIDDSFVNFDARRTERVMKLFKELESNQVLFFTCHKHLLNYFPENSIVNLQNIEKQVIS